MDTEAQRNVEEAAARVMAGRSARQLIADMREYREAEPETYVVVNMDSMRARLVSITPGSPLKLLEREMIFRLDADAGDCATCGMDRLDWRHSCDDGFDHAPTAKCHPFSD